MVRGITMVRGIAAPTKARKGNKIHFFGKAGRQKAEKQTTIAPNKTNNSQNFLPIKNKIVNLRRISSEHLLCALW